jgi:hypothetical protein
MFILSFKRPGHYSWASKYNISTTDLPGFYDLTVNPCFSQLIAVGEQGPEVVNHKILPHQVHEKAITVNSDRE